jgi:UDP-N-acetylglucosamine 4,6-dehydratase/5-epimerase
MNFEDIFKNKVVLITGGTGFLGRALTKKILEFDPHSIRLFSRDEVKHHKAQEIFGDNPKLRHLIGDVRDYQRLLKATKGVDIVIHAAALKRLDILEYNVEESIKTNIFGTLNVVNSCLKNNVKKVVMVSTDKACSPVNTYGACKFVSERIFTESNYSKGSSDIVFTIVRYGNVLESTGSVIPFFESKILEGKKIPLTDSRMTRFIISPEQAVELIFKSLKYCIGGEIFIPKLPAFKITDLIEILWEKHNNNTGIENIGLRPGEKIDELMINESEVDRTFNFEDIYVITSSIEKYSHTVKKPLYISEGEKLTEEIMKTYSSKDAVIPKSEVKSFFESLGLL